MMRLDKITLEDIVLVNVYGEKSIIKNSKSIIDLIINIIYEFETDNVIIDKNIIDEKFFILSSGIAGEITQKIINYNIKVAIYGDYTKYNSKSLRDFIYESNNGKNIFFVENKEQAILKLAKVHNKNI